LLFDFNKKIAVKLNGHFSLSVGTIAGHLVAGVAVEQVGLAAGGVVDAAVGVEVVHPEPVGLRHLEKSERVARWYICLVFKWQGGKFFGILPKVQKWLFTKARQ
jgi:hypothetical protein